MNYKVIMSILAILITVLLAILLIWGTSSCDARSNPVYIEGGNNPGTQNSETAEGSEENSSFHGVEDSIFDNLGEGQLIGDFEGSDKPAQSGSNGNAPASSSSSSSEQSGNSSGNSSRPSSGTSSNPSSGSSSSKPEINDAVLEGKMTYEEYMVLDGSEQEKYMKTFPDVADFFDWYNAAKDKYEAENPSIEVGDEPIDMDAIINGKNG